MFDLRIVGAAVVIALLVVGYVGWTIESLRAQAQRATAERDELAARVAQLTSESATKSATITALAAERDAAIAARQAADRALRAVDAVHVSLLKAARAARERASREKITLSAEEAAECKAILSVYERLGSSSLSPPAPDAPPPESKPPRRRS
ncbi:MAG: hypothetical protein NZ518_01610 [Dehalococcoidia bacterium]|nr:hypothetical protein [Dehalococcoidia bacterium]